jgi:hypothetical protein
VGLFVFFDAWRITSDGISVLELNPVSSGYHPLVVFVAENAEPRGFRFGLDAIFVLNHLAFLAYFKGALLAYFARVKKVTEDLTTPHAIAGCSYKIPGYVKTVRFDYVNFLFEFDVLFGLLLPKTVISI